MNFEWIKSRSQQWQQNLRRSTSNKLKPKVNLRVIYCNNIKKQTWMQRLTTIIKWPWTEKVKVRVTQKGCHCRCLDGHVKEPYEMFGVWDPDRRSNFFSPPAHHCAVTYITEIPLHVTLKKHFYSLTPIRDMAEIPLKRRKSSIQPPNGNSLSRTLCKFKDITPFKALICDRQMDIWVLFLPHSNFEAVCWFNCGWRRLAVALYRMICLVLRNNLFLHFQEIGD